MESLFAQHVGKKKYCQFGHLQLEKKNNFGGNQSLYVTIENWMLDSFHYSNFAKKCPPPHKNYFHKSIEKG